MKMEREEEIEDINNNISDNSISIELSLLSSNVDFDKIKISIPELFNEIISSKQTGLIYQNTFKLEPSKFKFLPNKLITIKLFKSSCCRQITLNEFQYHLTYLSEHSSHIIAESKYILILKNSSKYRDRNKSKKRNQLNKFHHKTRRIL